MGGKTKAKKGDAQGQGKGQSQYMQNRGSQAILLFVMDIVYIDCFFIFTRFIVIYHLIKSLVQAKTTVWWHQLDKQPQSSNSQSLFLKNTKAR